jgi:hypothetical protein
MEIITNTDDLSISLCFQGFLGLQTEHIPHRRQKTARRKARTIPDGSGRQTPSNGLTVTDTTTEPAGIVVMDWRNDFGNGGSEPEHNGGQHSSFLY